MKSFRQINKQLNREALWTAGLFVFFFIWWYACAYGLADAAWTVFGLPAWFFMSCIVGWVLCCVAVVVLVKKVFVNVDLEVYDQGAGSPAKGKGESR